jgi:hypothetical protein
MRNLAFRAVVSFTFVAALSACPPAKQECINGDEPVCPEGMLPPDFCNSQQEAQDDATNCHLTVATGGAACQRKQEVFISRLEDGGIDQDWYFAQLGTLTPRSLLHVNGGYSAPQTAVNFSLNVLKVDANGALATVTNGIDKHMAAAPKPVDLILPFGESNAKLFVLVGDDGQAGMAKVDNRNAYSLCMEIIDNPDVNEPNDTTPTAIPVAGAPIAMGSQSGFLATNDDVDLYSFPVTTAGRQIIYVHITEMGTHPTNPPPPYSLAYTLYDPSDVPISEGRMANSTLTIDLATARLAPMTGTYKLKISGFKEPNSMISVKGDLRVQYQVTVKLMPDLDTQEPNDSLAMAKPLSISPNGKTSVTGKLAHVPDPEWFVVSLPARASPSTFRYKVTASTMPGRFDPLSDTPLRLLRVTKRVTTGATSQDRLTNCRNNNAVCPKAGDAEPMLINAVCALSDPPQCLWAQREEELPRITNLRNLVGAIPVPANTATEFLINFEDEGQGASKYADDRDWTMELEWRDDPDEAARAGGPTLVTLSNAFTAQSGELTYGYGNYFDSRWFMNPEGLRGLNDYDAIDTDKDLFQVNYGGAMGDQGWEISWDLGHADGGTEPPGELALELTFCGTGPVPADGGLCGGAQNRILAFNSDSLTPWYLPQSVSNGRMLFTKVNNGASTTYTVAPVGCSCFSAARTAPGMFFANVASVHRLTNDPIQYRISQRITAYPGSFTLDGGSFMCPVADAGCGFAP